MSIQTEIQKPKIKPIVLFEIDISQFNTFWIPYTGCVYYIQLDADYLDIEGTATGFTSGAPTLSGITKVGSVIAGSVRLLEVFSPSECQLVDSSFFWDAPSKKLYVHCPDCKDPDLFIMRIGAAFGYRMYGSNQYSYVNGFIYEDRILEVPTISKSKDSFFFGKVVFDNGSVVLDNSDGYFDNLVNTQKMFGASARLYFGTENLTVSEFRKVYSGYVKNITLNTNQITFEVVDEREKLSKNIIQNYFTTADYPSLKDDDIGKPIPILYGECKRVPIIMVTEGRLTSVTGNHTGKVCDITTLDNAIKKVEKIYIGDTKSYTTASTKWSYNSTAATISVSTTVFKPGEKVRADAQGYVDSDGNLIENGLDIIKDILTKIYAVPFTNTFYNLANWDRAKALDVCYYKKDNTQLIDAIEEIANSTRGVFIIEDDGRYSCRIFYKYNASLQTITHNDLLEVAQISYNTTQTLSSLTIKYNKDFSEDEYLSILNDYSEESDIFNNLLFYRHEDFETLLTDSVSASTLGTDLLDLYGTVNKIINCKTFVQSIIREIGDVVTVEFGRPELPLQNDAKCEVIGISKNLSDGTIELTLRLFEQLADYYYYQGIYFGDNASNKVDNHCIIFGANGSKNVGSKSVLFGGTQRIAV